MKNKIIPCYDRERRTCLQVGRDDDRVQYVPLDMTDGLEVLSASCDEFDRRFHPMVDYPAERAAKLYLSYGMAIGASDQVLDHLGRIITITPQEYDMATAKKKAAVKAAETTQQATDKKVNGKKKPGKAPGARVGGETASRMFQDLIMEGKLTDDQIFAKVKAKFDLDDKKRGYVKWYRNNLAKQGKKPPAAK